MSEQIINLSQSAIQRIKELLKDDTSNKKLRVYITGGGCSGFQYGFSFEQKSNETDIFIKNDGVEIVVDAVSYQYLKGANIDFKKNLLGSRFVVENPNAKTTCSCGSSFSV